MPGWLTWLLIGVFVWSLASIALTLGIGRFLELAARGDRFGGRVAATERGAGSPEPAEAVAHISEVAPPSQRILIVDDDPSLRLLLRTTLTADDFEVAEAHSAQSASDLARFWRPAVVLLDVAMPGIDGLSFCSDLKRKPSFGRPIVILLTGTELTDSEAASAGADALLRKPFSPLELMGLIDRLTGAEGVERRIASGADEDDQLLLYARDLGRLVEIERMQRRVVQDAYRETVTALANALEAKDVGTRFHSLRVRDYAVRLTAAIEPDLLADPSLEYGFLLHDVGKIGVPTDLLAKQGPLTPEEYALMQDHTVIGAQILDEVPFLHGEGIKVIRSHHERWDGTGYPDRLAGTAIPLSARIFAVADAMDAMTEDRPYRDRASWETATREIRSQSGSQFDPAVVDAFMRENDVLRRVRHPGKAA
jgi:response regulator RpfG family c-di-GMP phosphodiesterase